MVEYDGRARDRHEGVPPVSPNDEPSGPGRGPARPGALLAVRVSPADVGRRVTLRHRYDASTLTDVVGRLTQWRRSASHDDEVLLVEKRDGTLVEVRRDDLVAAKVVAPEISAEALQAVAEKGWPPREAATLGDWTMRATGGVTGRANSVRVAGDPGLPLPQALASVTEWYAGRGLPPLLQVPAPSSYDADLDAAGWTVRRRTVLRTTGTAALLEQVRARVVPPDLLVEHHDATTAEFLAFTEPDLDPVALAAILDAPPERTVVAVRDGATGVLLGTGRASATGSAAGRWAGLTSIATSPVARRRGVATAVLGGLAGWALDRECGRSYLQVLEANSAAWALYDALGFDVHHAYEYRAPDRLAGQR